MNERDGEIFWEIKGLKYLLIGLAFILPVTISVAEPLAFAAAAIWLLSLRHASIRAQWRANPLRWAVVLFALVAVGVSLFFGVRPGLSARKFHRLLFLALAFITPAAVLRERTDCTLKILRHVMTAYLAGCTVLGMIDTVRIPLFALRGGNLFDAGSMRDPQFYLLALCLLASALLGGVSIRRAWPWLTASFFSSLGIILHFKRGVWLALVIVLAQMACLVRRRILLAGIVVAVLAALALPQVRERLVGLKDVFSTRSGDRYVLWTDTAPSLFSEYPLGMGWCAVKQRDFALYSSHPVQPKLNHLHNNLLQVRLELGWAGLIAWVFMMGAGWFVLWVGAKRSSREGGPWKWLGAGLVCGYTGLLINGMVESSFGDSEIMMLFCLILGSAVVLYQAGALHSKNIEKKAVTGE